MLHKIARTGNKIFYVVVYFSCLRSLVGSIVHDLAEKVFWSSILPSISRFDVQFLSDDLSCFQFDRCKLHARGHVQHEYTHCGSSIDGSACDVVSGTTWVWYWWPCRLPEVSACRQTSMAFNCAGLLAEEIFSVKTVYGIAKSLNCRVCGMG